MIVKIDIIFPEIFPKHKILAGVTKKNSHIFPNGLSFGVTETFPKEVVLEHRQLLAKYLGFNLVDFVFLRQAHTDIIHLVNDNICRNNGIDGENKDSGMQNLDEYLFGDAIITSAKRKILTVKIADCAGILIYDPKNEVIGAVHSGWRGSSKKILPKAINLMKSHFNSNPADILVYISPVPSAEKYQVGKEVAELFPFSTVKDNSGNYFFDNRKELIIQLMESGIRKQNIELSPMCTISNLDLHSYRRDKEKSGRMCAFICMFG